MPRRKITKEELEEKLKIEITTIRVLKEQIEKGEIKIKEVKEELEKLNN